MVHRNVIKEMNIWLSEAGHFPAFKWRKLVGRKISDKLEYFFDLSQIFNRYTPLMWK